MRWRQSSYKNRLRGESHPVAKKKRGKKNGWTTGRSNPPQPRCPVGLPRKKGEKKREQMSIHVSCFRPPEDSSLFVEEGEEKKRKGKNRVE